LIKPPTSCLGRRVLLRAGLARASLLAAAWAGCLSLQACSTLDTLGATLSVDETSVIQPDMSAAPLAASGPTKAGPGDPDDKAHRPTENLAPASGDKDGGPATPGNAGRKTRKSASGEAVEPGLDTLAGVVSRAVEDNPKISLAEAKSAEAKAGIDIARSGLFPTLTGAISSGHGINGTFGKDDLPYFDRSKAMGSWYSQGTITGRQLLFDFGATQSDIERARASLDSEQLRVIGTAEDIAVNAARAYLNVLEKRELLALASANLAALRDLARLVDENQRAGNGTLADVKRISARVVDAESAEGDQSFELQNAIDTFRRLVRAEPGALKPAPLLDRAVPDSEKAAIEQAFAANPSVLASVAAVRARRAEIAFTKESDLPKLTLESDITGKNYRQLQNRAELESRNLVTLRYTFLDGGRRSAQIDAAGSRLAQEEASLRDQRETLEADIRRYYWVRRNARAKAMSLGAGVEDSEKARELYKEQFAGGKRSLLELLDVQSSAYLARRSMVLNNYEAQRAAYGILYSVGRFIPAAVASASR
jgi:adhesin transport system outer membrane protein